MTIKPGAIGVFDSGVGGLSVLRHICETLPDERLIYVADSGHVPYGDKPAHYIEQRSLTLARFLVEQGVDDAIVIACNTATAAAAASLRSRFDVPIISMELIKKLPLKMSLVIGPVCVVNCPSPC